MTCSWRLPTLADRHSALGFNLEVWSRMGTAWSYDQCADEGYVAVRAKAGLKYDDGAPTSPGFGPD